jgi:RNA polymerase sigma-70 factor, ECF subfamily
VSAFVGVQGTIDAVTTSRDRFHRLYASSADDVIRFVARRVAPSQVEDVVADAFVTVWRRVEDLPLDPGEARAWVFGIARQCARNAVRGTGRQQALAVRIAEQPGPGSGVSLHASFDSVETRLDLVTAWRLLDPIEQETLALTVFDELTSAEAGLVLGITAAAYRVRLMRARRALRRHLEPTPGQEHTP